jgi:hypothetical protein
MLVFDPIDGLWFDDGKPSTGEAPSANPAVSPNDAIYDPLNNKIIERVARKVIQHKGWSFNPIPNVDSGLYLENTALTVLKIIDASINTFGIDLQRGQGSIFKMERAGIYQNSAQVSSATPRIGLLITQNDFPFLTISGQAPYEYHTALVEDVLARDILTISGVPKLSSSTYSDIFGAEFSFDKTVEIPPAYSLYLFAGMDVKYANYGKVVTQGSVQYYLRDS